MSAAFPLFGLREIASAQADNTHGNWCLIEAAHENLLPANAKTAIRN
jgi:hypothetical protein